MNPIAEENLRTAAAFARLLSLDGPLYTAEEVRAFAADCGLDEHGAFLLLLAAALGREDDRTWQRERLAPSVRVLDPAVYRADPYYAGIRFPEIARGRWRLTQMTYAPYQLIPCGHTRLTPQGAELPRLGYFTEPFSYPAVLEKDREWMTVTPNEIATMAAEIGEARGNIAVLGLGLGYFAFMCARKPQVSRVWHDVGDGLPLYLRLLPLAPRWRAPFRYWIEEDMLIFLRGLLLEEGREMDLAAVKRWAQTASGEEISRVIGG